VINFNSRGDEFRIFDRMAFCKGRCFHELLENYFIALPSVVIRKTVLDQENEWFDPSFSIVGDYDFFIRIAYSWKLDNCRDALARYRVHESSGLRTTEHLIYGEDMALLNKFCNQWPNFYQKYGRQMETRIAYRRASYLWRNGRSREARTCLHGFKRHNFKTFLLYLATLTSPSVVYSIVDRFRKVVRP